MTDTISVAMSRPMIVALVLFRKNTICMTAGKMKVVSTSVKLPISDRMSAKDGIKQATTPISTISTVRRMRYFLEEMKILPCSTSSPSIVSLMGSIHKGKPPTTVNHIIRFSNQPSAKPSGSDVMILS